MEIHELNTKALTDPAYVAFDDGSDTYKANFKDIIDDAAADAVEDAVSAVFAKTTGTITLSSNVTATSSFSCICEKRGNFVTVYIAFTATEDIATSTVVATIPSGFRPPRQFRTVVYKSGGYGVLQFNTSGTINAIAAISNTNTVIGIVSYVL